MAEATMQQATKRNKQVVLKEYVKGMPTEDNFELRKSTILPFINPDGTKAVLLKNLYLAVDADLRRQLSGEDYPQIQLKPCAIKRGSVISGYGVAKVFKSTNPDYNEGDYVWGITGWEEYTMIKDDPQFLRKIKHYPDVNKSYYTGLFGIGGFAAYVGISNVAAPKQGEVVYISAAAGGVGQLAGQFAKLNNCYVVGSAGTDEKVHLLKNKFGFDDAFNYKKETDLGAALTRYCPNGIDLYFDNVGGPLLDEVLLHMNPNSKIVVSGMISQYNHLEKPDGIHNLFHLVTKRIVMEGFHIDNDNLNYYDEFVDKVSEMLYCKNITYLEDPKDGLENAAAALIGIFYGENIGKQVIVVADED
ncbi:NADPH-dependent oxidoreductase 2-alkenal reductase-like [Lycium ferocissimum]|uniref:NADPH-dependent oxidoreductase 2-alkenal reductase-like n=1 Tax=Lycium ferocissimum TaxID=112874 RepID=UPI002814DEF8|nr:NADPH-dependent oxidoreductase 2-alkenal reductase-like [Lycium ferocissimum]